MTSISKMVNKHLALFAFLLLLLPGAVLAQEAISYTVSPTIFDMTANPGQSFSSTIRIINTNPFELRVYFDRTNFIPKDEDGVPQFITIEESNSNQTTFAEWISTEKEMVIAPEQTIELPFTITVPENAAPGGHFAAIMVSTKPSFDSENKTKVQTAQSISSLLFMRVTGDITEDSVVRSFRTSDYLLSKPEATFELRIENKGNVHIQPQGEIKIFNMWGKERGVIPVNQQTLFGNVLPQSVRKFAFTWTSEWSISDIGRYTAVATLAYGVDTRQSISADTAFWIIPWKFLLIIISVVGGFIALVTWAIKVYVRRMLMLAGVSPGVVSTSPTPTPATTPKAEDKSKKTKLKKTETVKEKTKRATAPIEAGILDLRGRLEQKMSFKGRVEAILLFVKQYWKFFTVALAVILFLILVTLFFKGAFAPTRDYQVTTENQGRSTTLKNTNTTTNESPATQKSNTTPALTLVNRSGNDTLLELVKAKLTNRQYVVGTTTSETGANEEKTVIVYPPNEANKALELSTLLNNALLSAYSGSTTQSEIVIYIGSDLETAE